MLPGHRALPRACAGPRVPARPEPALVLGLSRLALSVTVPALQREGEELHHYS